MTPHWGRGRASPDNPRCVRWCAGPPCRGRHCRVVTVSTQHQAHLQYSILLHVLLYFIVMYYSLPACLSTCILHLA
jgi:hypothetical protein